MIMIACRVMEKEESLDEIFDLKPIFPEIFSSDHHFSSGSNKPQTSDDGSRSKANTKQPKSSFSWNSCHPQETILSANPSSSSAAAAASIPKLISFENSENIDMDYTSNFDQEMAEDYSLASGIINFSSSSANDDSEGNNQYHDSSKGILSSQKRVSTATRTPSQALEHLMAERKRRENLSQLFISLSKVVPGLKKLDKASLLEDGVNYLKALQERVRVLEEEEIRRSSIGTSKDDSCSNKEISSGDNSTGITSGSADPEIQARISDKNVLIKIFCKKQKELMSRIPGEMEKIHLSVVDLRIMPFGGAALDITILAEMQSEFEGTVKDIIDQLHSIFLNLQNSTM